MSLSSTYCRNGHRHCACGGRSGHSHPHSHQHSHGGGHHHGDNHHRSSSCFSSDGSSDSSDSDGNVFSREQRNSQSRNTTLGRRVQGTTGSRTAQAQTNFLNHTPIRNPSAEQISRQNLQRCNDDQGAGHVCSAHSHSHSAAPSSRGTTRSSHRHGTVGRTVNSNISSSSSFSDYSDVDDDDDDDDEELYPYCHSHMREYFGNNYANRTPREILDQMADIVGVQRPRPLPQSQSQHQHGVRSGARTDSRVDLDSEDEAPPSYRP
ncbi:hypothetical protein GGR54DRAFT_641780 [Hypoxylon sp. NC1633]|nr:hypothetical protein GGR54DRAFT_641780 [Hypoxylon sp. NC1633]